MREVKKWADEAAGLISSNRTIKSEELCDLYERAKADTFDGLMTAFYFGVAVAYKAMKDGAICSGAKRNAKE